MSILWREAAARALAVPELPATTLYLETGLPPAYLSPLVSHLVAGCARITVELPLLAVPGVVGFLDTARPKELRVDRARLSMHLDASDEVASALQQCASLRALDVNNVLLTTFPTGLRVLHLRWGIAAPTKPWLPVSRLRRGLERLPDLVELTLELSVAHALVSGCFPSLPALRQLTVWVTCGALQTPQHLPSILAAAASLGVSLGIGASLSPAGWQALHKMLQSGPPLSLVHVITLGRYRVDVRLLHPGLVSCRELVVQDLDCRDAEALLQQFACETVLCQIEVSRLSASLAVQWSAVSVRPDVYVLDVSAELLVTGCDGSLPSMPQGWALVVRLFPPGSVSGLPWDELRPGPRGCLVWRNSLSDAQLLEALDKLI